MNFQETVRRAKGYLQEEGRVSLRALKLEFQLDDDQLEALVEELVDIQQLAAHEGKALAWVGPVTTRAAAKLAAWLLDFKLLSMLERRSRSTRLS